jgi:hypothetical protein
MNQVLIIGAAILAVLIVLKILGRLITIAVIAAIGVAAVIYFSNGHQLSDLPFLH